MPIQASYDLSGNDHLVEEKEQPHKIKSICKRLMLNISQVDVGPNTKNNSSSLLVLGTASNSESLEMPTIDSGSW